MRLKLFALVFGLTATAFGQIEFQTYVITDTTQTSYQTRDARGVDMDGDGDLDVLAGSRVDDRVVWYENVDGQGNFGTQRIISLNIDDVREVINVDVDGDGDQDVVSISYALNSVLWHENLDGTGSFGIPQLIENDLEDPEHVRVGDLDGDGDQDVIAQGGGFMDDYVRWYENLDGQGDFAPGVSLTTQNSRGEALDVADVDGDGDLDVITASVFDDIFWMENDGTGQFSPEIEIVNNAGQHDDLMAGDLDGDGDTDLVVTQFEPWEVQWYENLDGNGTFSGVQVINDQVEFPEEVFLSDVDADNDLDILISSRNERAFLWLENLDGNANFSNAQVIQENIRIPISVFGGDFDGDGTIDVLSASQADGIIGLHRNLDGNGNFLNREAINNTFYYPEFVDAVDVDEDGDLDLMFGEDGNGTIGWLENTNGLGQFSDHKNLISVAQSNIKYFMNADLDGDGDLDIVSSSRDNNARLGWMRNLPGPNNYSDLIPLLDGVLQQIDEVKVFDIDGDDDLDLLISGSTNDRVGWLENTDGNGTFGPLQEIASVNMVRTAHALDVDGDGDLDVVAASEQDENVVWFENLDGNGTFGPSILIRENVGEVQELNAGDIDSDGDEDLLVGRHYYENIGGSFIRRTFFGGEQPWSVRLFDLDGDQDLDIVWGFRLEGSVSWLENTDGFGDFGNLQVIADGFSSVYGIGYGDIDGDGDPDILSASREDAKIAWHKATLTTNLITGFTRFDTEGNACDNTDPAAPNLLVRTQRDGGYSYGAWTQANGSYQLYVDEGSYTTELAFVPEYFTGSPDNYQNTFTGIGEVFQGDFCLEADAGINDLSVAIYPSGEARPGFSARYFIVFKNRGTSTLSGTVDFQFDETKMTFDVANQDPIAQTSNSLTFEFFDLQPFLSDWVRLDFNIFEPPTTDIDDVLVFESNILPVAGDANPDDNTAILEQIVVGSFDPNDIQVVEGEEIFVDEVDDYLHYLIRFQNTGTASAINVRVTNPIDPNLDWTTMEVEALSHEGLVEIIDGRQAEFTFNDIDLPPQSETESGSQGFIAYRIKPSGTVGLGDSMSNNANIYFDFNPPILTNTVTTTVVEDLGTADMETDQFTIYPNPLSAGQILRFSEAVTGIEINDMTGRLILSRRSDEPISSIVLDQLNTGLYFLSADRLDGRSTVVRFLKK